MKRLRALIVGFALHIPLILAVVALFELRPMFVFMGILGHGILSFTMPPGLALLAALPRELATRLGARIAKAQGRAFTGIQMISIVFSAVVGTLIWIVYRLA